MNYTYDIIIIGGGAMGLSTAYQLSKTDKKVLVLEQFGFLNNKGSSAGASRQFRVQYAQKYMAQLAVDSIPYWNRLEEEAKETLIDRVGSLWFGDPNISSQEGGIGAAMRVMNELQIPYTPLNAKDIEARFPFKNIPERYNGFFQEDGGIINLEATLKALFNIADNASNVDLREYHEVTDIISKPNGEIEVYSSQEKFIAEKLIITPGAYVNDILKHFGLSVNVDIWEMSSAYYKKKEAVKFPTWFVFQKPQNTSLFYGFPEEDWANPGYIRVAPDIPDRVIRNPKERTNVPSEKSLELNSAWVRDHMVGLEDTPEYTATCLISLSNNNKELLIDTLPEWVHNHQNIIVYTGGWAAKFIPLLGQILAEKAITGTTKYDLTPFKIDWPAVRGEVSNRFKTLPEKNLKLDVAVVGAGASGLWFRRSPVRDRSSTQSTKPQ